VKGTVCGLKRGLLTVCIGTRILQVSFFKCSGREGETGAIRMRNSPRKFLPNSSEWRDSFGKGAARK
jgi:hypothetical protein